MAKKKTGLSQTLFSGINPYGAADAALTELPLAAIRPDPDQPRRLLPPDLAAALARGELSPEKAMTLWLGGDHVGGGRLSLLIQLAESIAQHGLINPVTVRPIVRREGFPRDVSHLLVTGERRYWAQQLLVVQGRTIQAGSEHQDPARIAVREAPDGITVRAHQLIENLIRTDINAIEKAEGLRALRAELSGLPLDGPQASNQSVIPGSLSSQDSEVIPGSPDAGGETQAGAKLVPWTEVARAINISNRYRILLTSVLDLTPGAQALVMENGFSEKMIRPIVQKLKPFPDLQLAALRQLAQWKAANEAGADFALNRSVKTMVDQLLESRARDKKGSGDAVRAIKKREAVQRLRRPVGSTLRVFDEIIEHDELTLLARDLALDARNAGALEDLYELNERLAKLLDEVYGYQQGR